MARLRDFHPILIEKFKEMLRDFNPIFIEKFKERLRDFPPVYVVKQQKNQGRGCVIFHSVYVQK